ncbi:MAG: Rad52/Rad22 family DNA repair protein [Fusobacterium sp.]|nr:Rad52/Rad22 family DNA repair protein [Fusobacterium sp.]MDO5789096.1 Rad52/Rad22 family DNA repair protein [Fusobacterium sp.]
MEKIFELLQKEFKDDELEYRVGATNEDKTLGLALVYVQARAIQKRLDEVLGVPNWRVSYREIQGGFIAKLELRINNEWISKEDGAGNTEYEAIKGGISYAFKRVASVWGIGRYLYSIENKWFPIEKRGKSYIFKNVPKNICVPTTSKEEIKSEDIKLTFGKYKGKTLGEIYSTNPNYLNYLIQNSSDENIIAECKKILKLKIA